MREDDFFVIEIKRTILFVAFRCMVFTLCKTATRFELFPLLNSRKYHTIHI